MALLGTLACDSPPPPSPDHTIHTDSAGIPIATATRPLWGPGEGWTVGPEPLIEIGTLVGEPEYEFGAVVAATRLSNGHIVVADRGHDELRSYDETGAFRWRAGRAGEGPGEFSSLDFVGKTSGDTLVAYDGAAMRAQLFSAEGRLVRTLPVTPPEGDASARGSVADRAVGVVQDRLIVRFLDFGERGSSGVVRWPNERLVALDLRTGSTTTLAVLPGQEADVELREDDGYRHNLVFFGKAPEYGASPGRLAVVDTEFWSVRLMSPQDGAIQGIVRREIPPTPTTDALFEEMIDGLTRFAFPDPEAVPSEQIEAVRRGWQGSPRAPTLPLLYAIHVDAAEHLWVHPYFLTGFDPPPFEIHAPDGSWLGSVAVPPGLDRGFIQYQSPYMEIGEDYLLGVWKGELDTQQVRMYGVER